MRRLALVLAAAVTLCASAAYAAERTVVVPAVPAGLGAPAVSAPQLPTGLSVNGVVPRTSLPALPSTARDFGYVTEIPAADRASAALPQAAAPAAAANRGDFRSGAEMSDARTPRSGAMGQISAIGRNVGGNASGSENASSAGASNSMAVRLDATFDGSTIRAASDAAPVAGRESRWTARLGRATRSLARKAGAAAVATLLLTAPALAQAAPGAGPVVISQAASLSWLAGVQPIAAAAGAVLGALYGLLIARGKDSDASGGDALAAALRYGVIGGASVYMLLDLTQVAFIGPGVGLKPLSAAVATAALGRAAFQGKFSDAATTSADRIVAAFPAVAAALGLSIGVSLAAPALSYTLAMTAMAVTGVAAAIYAAVFKVGRSPADGPALMGKGYVLQALMCGLALALATPWQVWTFAVMGAAGFGLVLFAFGRELWSLLPGRNAAPPAPPKA